MSIDSDPPLPKPTPDPGRLARLREQAWERIRDEDVEYLPDETPAPDIEGKREWSGILLYGGPPARRERKEPPPDPDPKP